MKPKDIKIEPTWAKTKEEIWNTLFDGLEDTPQQKKKNLFRRLSHIQYIAAAVLLGLILCATAFLYTDTYYAQRGEHLTVTLPDKSTVMLNADSKITYKPLWWRISRNVTLMGEAYFEVTPGSDFTVASGDKTVTVLGTSFNIYSRDSVYKVSCLTGKVQVAIQSETVYLTPHMSATLLNRKWEVTESTDMSAAIGWTKNKYSFIGVPLHQVIAEIERQYDIKVTTESTLDFPYTGDFSKERTPKEVLEIVGKPFGITFSIK